jgi:hypothetical protein
MTALHIGCNVTTCPNGACRFTGQCKDLQRVASPPLAPEGYCSPTGAAWCETAKITRDGPCDDCPEAAPRTIIAFTGLAGSGKSTAAQHLVATRGFQRIRFAGPLKAMMAALGLTHEEIEGSEKETPCALLGGKTPRYAMQTIGTEWGRDLIAQDLWIRAFNAALLQVPAGVPVVIDDCRFPNEAEAVRAAGGLLVRIDRPGVGAGAAGHSSESHVLPTDAALLNYRSAAQLRDDVDNLVSDLSWADR